MNVSIDASDEDVLPGIGIAPDGAGNTYLLRISNVDMTINHDQLESLYAQIRGWFQEGA